jgi:hypothetical protein
MYHLNELSFVWLQVTFVTIHSKAVGGGFEPPTVQLAAIQSLVVYPSRLRVPALYRVYSELTTPETGGHGCQVSSSYSIKN